MTTLHANPVTFTAPEAGEFMAETVTFHGSRGQLVGELAYGLSAPRAACLLLNPHPFMGGAIDNNVIRSLAHGLAGHGCVTLRFDYSGCGSSDGTRANVASAMLEFWQSGHAPDDPRMVEDGRAALRFLAANSRVPVIVIGYSFGAYVASQSLASDIAGMVVISPTLRHHDFSPLGSWRKPRLVIYSDNDFATPRDVTESWIAGLGGDVDLLCVQGGEHFFRGAEGQILQAVRAFASDVMSKEEA